MIGIPKLNNIGLSNILRKANANFFDLFLLGLKTTRNQTFLLRAQTLRPTPTIHHKTVESGKSRMLQFLHQRGPRLPNMEIWSKFSTNQRFWVQFSFFQEFFGGSLSAHPNGLMEIQQKFNWGRPITRGCVWMMMVRKNSSQKTVSFFRVMVRNLMKSDIHERSSLTESST